MTSVLQSSLTFVCVSVFGGVLNNLHVYFFYSSSHFHFACCVASGKNKDVVLVVTFFIVSFLTVLELMTH